MTKPTRLTRRDFLRTTTTAAAAATAPFILPSHVWSAEVKPNDRITIGCIGMGTQGTGLMDGFISRKDTQVVAVCDVDTTRREARKQRVEELYARQKGVNYKGCAAYKDFREIINRKDIDAVVIATPDHWHAFIAIAAVNSGKDVYCEKPLTESIHEAKELIKAVRKNDRVFQVGSMQRSSREFRVACELVRNGVIGDIKTIDVSVGGPGKVCDLPTEEMEPGLDWNMWLGPALERGYHSKLSPRGVHKHFPGWRDYREFGGGGVTDWGAHHFDIAQWGMGMDESGPVEIIPAENPKANSGVRYKYANGTEVFHKGGPGVLFHGSKGKVMVNRGKFELTLGEAKIDSPAEAEKQHLADAKVKLYKSSDHKGDWIEAIRKRSKPICDVEVGARTVMVCQLVNLAYYHQTAMKWDPKNNVFVSGGKAEWLDVPHRDPWKV
jgi:predicted dehydrogenase